MFTAKTFYPEADEKSRIGGKVGTIEIGQRTGLGQEYYINLCTELTVKFQLQGKIEKNLKCNKYFPLLTIMNSSFNRESFL